MQDLLKDLGLAARTLGRRPGFALVVVLTLALGIGANSAIFSLMDQTLLRALPVKDPQQLVLLDGPGAFSGRTHNDQTFSYPMYRDFRDRNAVFDGVAARFRADASFGHSGETQRATAELVSGNFFEVLGVRAHVGRTLTPADDETPGADPVIVLAHGFWMRRFGGDPGIVGQTVSVNARPMSVVGVAAAGFFGLEVGSTPDFFVPMAMKAALTPTWDDLENRRSRWLNVVARLKPGVSAAQAEAGMNVLYQQILQHEIQLIPDASERFKSRFLAKHLDVLPGARGLSELRRSATLPLLLLMAMVALVLLIACANVANLMLARAAERQRDMAIRLALGAGRRQLARPLLAESLLLAAAGGLLALVFARWAGTALIQALPTGDGSTLSLSAEPDARMIGFTAAVSLLTALLFGLAPALRSTRPALLATLKDEALSVVGGGHVRLRRSLVVAQVSLSLLLLVGAGLFARSLVNLRRLDPGFRSEGLLTFAIDASLNGYTPQQSLALYDRLAAELGALPGVQGAAAAVEPLLADSEWSSTVRVDGYTPKDGENMNPGFNAVGPGFLRTMGTPLIAGREFGDSDATGAPRVAIVNQSFARYFFGELSPLGRRLGFGRDRATDIEIVGLVGDGKSLSLREEPKRFVYIPLAQHQGLARVSFYVRAAGEPALLGDRVREAVQRADPNLPLFGMKTMPAQVSESLFVERMVAALSAGFGALATLLAAIGLYGVMSYTVAARTREIGIRMALGADRSKVLGMVLRDVALLAGIGIGLGLPSAVALARLVSSQLYGLQPADPGTLAAATALLATVALLAGYLPARRATRIDPMAALREL